MLDFSFLNSPAILTVDTVFVNLSEYGSTYFFALLSGLYNTLLLTATTVSFSFVVSAAIFMLLHNNRALCNTFSFLFSIIKVIPVLGVVVLMYFGYMYGMSVWESVSIGGVAVLSMAGLTVPYFSNGIFLQTEFLCLFLALSVYTIPFIVDILMSAYQSMPANNKKISDTLVSGTIKKFTVIYFPYTINRARSALTNQAVNLFKNSSLGVVIGYSELTNVGITTLSITGKTIECFIIMSLVYFIVSLILSRFANR